MFLSIASICAFSFAISERLGGINGPKGDKFCNINIPHNAFLIKSKNVMALVYTLSIKVATKSFNYNFVNSSFDWV